MSSLPDEAYKDIEKDIPNEYRLNKDDKKEENVSFTFNFYTFTRFFLFTIGIIAVILNSIYGFALPNTNVDCFLDKSFELTENINKYLAENKEARHILIACSSFCVDFVILYMGIYWCMYGKSWRLITTLFCFYGIRGVIQNLFQMRYPDGYLWEFPGIPSVSVSYLKTNDFFFSGHVGFPIIIGMECHRLNKKYLLIFCLFTSLFEACTMIVTRGHYIIDIITGMGMAHYFYIIVDKYITFMDDYFPMDRSNKNDSEYKPALIQ